MNQPLDEQEQNYLRGLQESPVWNRILKKLREFEPPPRFSPKMDVDKTFHLWIYRSGGLDATESLLDVLAQKQPLIHEDNDE